MDDKILIEELEALAHQLHIDIRYEVFSGETRSPGGMCRIRGRRVIILNKGGSIREKATTLTRALSRFDLSSIYLKPALRELLETSRSQDNEA